MTRSLFLLILVLSALGEFATGAFIPLTSLAQDDLGMSRASTQASIASFVLLFAIAQLVLGPLSDTLGRKPIILAGLAVFLVGSMLGTLASSGNTLILARAIQGTGAAAGYVVGRAVLRDISDELTLPKRMSAVMLAFAAAILTGRSGRQLR